MIDTRSVVPHWIMRAHVIWLFWPRIVLTVLTTQSPLPGLKALARRSSEGNVSGTFRHFILCNGFSGTARAYAKHDWRLHLIYTSPPLRPILCQLLLVHQSFNC